MSTQIRERPSSSSSNNGFLTQLKYNALNAATKSPFYDWTLSSKDIPHTLAVKLIDPWPGNSDSGRALCKGQFIIQGSIFEIQTNLFDDYAGHKNLTKSIHNFSWLRDLRCMGGDTARKTARDMVGDWINRYDRFDPQTWDTALLAERLYFWITSFDFFGASAGTEFQNRYFDSLIRQARHLSRSIKHDITGLALLRAARGLIYAGLSFTGREAWVIHGFNIILNQLGEQILSDGGHVSRSPQATAESLQILLDLRCALRRADLPVPDLLQHAIDRNAQAVKFFRGLDKKLPLFHGSSEGDGTLLDALSSQSLTSNKTLKSLPETGYERMQLGRCCIIVDASTVPDAPHDLTAHSSPSSFELSYGRERVFTNCGAHPTSPEWQQILRHTAAHNGLTINGAPVHDLSSIGSFKTRHSPIQLKRQDQTHSILLDMTHNGFEPSHGITHQRRFYISDNGLDVRGEDTLTSPLDPEDALSIAIRFHLHPRVLVSLVQDGQEALLRLQSGLGFRFFSVGGTLSLENSIYLGHGLKPVKTKQLVISSRMLSQHHQLKWALQRE